MAVKSLHQFFYYHNKYLNSMKCREISMGPSIRTIQCSISVTKVVQSVHNILEPVLRQPSGYNVKHCSKSLLKGNCILG
jgi:hypothetical protein